MVRQPGSKGSLSHRMFVALVVACTSVAVVVTIAASLIYQNAFLADEHEQLAGECRTIASLLNLAKFPASTVQILGAEKALFRALKTRHETPKYGLIYHASLVGQAAAKHKGKISRVLAVGERRGREG